ncbi:MAG: hypothetical protein HYV15_07050 [Elusimicrobia bacterium]|nr:hypothetical protein [Elusimicrobiota bacterium]
MRYSLLAALLVLSACKNDDIQVYKVAKPADSGAAVPAAAPAGLPDGHPSLGAGAGMGSGMGSGMGAMPPELAAMATATPNSIAWKGPAGWTEKPASGMRRATFIVPGGAELSVISLPGDAGGELANVNRWRGQLGLAPWDAAGLGKAAQAVASPAGRFSLVDLEGSSQRMLAAMLTRDGETWFFKLLGSTKSVGDAKGAFKAFIGGVKPAS